MVSGASARSERSEERGACRVQGAGCRVHSVQRAGSRWQGEACDIAIGALPALKVDAEDAVRVLRIHGESERRALQVGERAVEPEDRVGAHEVIAVERPDASPTRGRGRRNRRRSSRLACRGGGRRGSRASTCTRASWRARRTTACSRQTRGSPSSPP